MRKVDIHCHILPGLDDGACSEEESLEMLKMGFEQGIDTVIATSHASKKFPKSKPEVVKEQCEILEKKAKQNISADFKIYPGQEILFADSVISKLNKGEMLTIADSIYILIEFLPTTPYSVIYQYLRELSLSPYCPILAHMERYKGLRENGRVDELMELGIMMQMNYRPIAGRWYEETTRWCRRMLKEGNVHFLATDMHNAQNRSPSTMEAIRWMERHLDETYMEEICYRNAEHFLLSSENKQ